MIFQDELDWDEAPDGATHALFTTEKGFWYFWKVTDDPVRTHYHDGKKWVRHVLQNDSIIKLNYSTVEKRPTDRDTRAGR